jgi:hypothetical protein
LSEDDGKHDGTGGTGDLAGGCIFGHERGLYSQSY